MTIWKWKSGVSRKVWGWLGLVLIALLAFGIRFPQLDSRPLHTDEAVNASLLAGALQGNGYRYDPYDYHGPTLHLLATPWLRVLGVTSLAEMQAWHLRAVSLAAGLLAIVSLGFFSSFMGWRAVWFAGLLFACGAPFVYFNGTFIHESLFILFTFLTLASLLRFRERGKFGWAVATGGSAGLLMATKEIAGAELLILFGAVWITCAVNKSSGENRAGRFKVWAGLAAAFGVTVCLLYSSWGLHPEGVGDLLSSAPRLWQRAGGEGHEKPWFTYLEWMARPSLFAKPWSGWIALVFAAAGAGIAWRRPPVRLFLLLALGLFSLYSAIPYKTPWLQLNLLAPLYILAGIGLASVAQWGGRWRALLGGGLAMLILWTSSRETIPLCYRFPVDDRNPLAYSPTSPNILDLVESIDGIAAVTPGGKEALVVQVVGGNYWPLPWYLRKYPNTGYWQEMPRDLKADVVISSLLLAERASDNLGQGWSGHWHGVRAEVPVVLFTKGAAQ